jgi:aspartyl-tRNA(Asn)/glutamyl-tRNA(Gln) amidotransferase subunit A
MPCGYDSNNLPIGIQLIAPPFAEEIILRAGDAFERTGAFKLRTPAV